MRASAILLMIVIFVFSGCGPMVPSQIVWRPWARTMDSPTIIQPGMSVSTSVQGATEPLIGDESLLQECIRGDLDALLGRRGFVPQDSSADLTCILRYKTERTREFSLSTHHSSAAWATLSMSTSAASASGAQARGSMATAAGVSIASTVARLISAREESYTQTATERISFIHTVALDISDRTGRSLWKGESYWMSGTVDIMDDAAGVLQLLLSKLPSDRSGIPRVPKLKASHLNNFLSEYCANRYYSCPALPYRIIFPVNDSYPQRILKDESGFGYVEDIPALPAYVDLARTAEYALPIGKKDLSNPVDLDIWRKVVLGSKYYLGDSEEPVFVLMTLHGTRTAYEVKNCRLATPEEYSKFERKMDDWQAKLMEYFSMYEK